MGRPSALLEHLFRRAGFGLTQAERDGYDGMEYYAAVNRHRHHDGGSILSQQCHRRRAAALAVPHDALAGAAAGADGAHLAQPLCDRL